MDYTNLPDGRQVMLAVKHFIAGLRYAVVRAYLFCNAYFYFAVDRRLKALAPQHPEWQNKELFASILKDDFITPLNDFFKIITILSQQFC